MSDEQDNLAALDRIHRALANISSQLSGLEGMRMQLKLHAHRIAVIETRIGGAAAVEQGPKSPHVDHARRPVAKSRPEITEYDPELTPTGNNYYIPASKWDAIQQQIENLQRAREVESAEKAGAQKALAELERQSQATIARNARLRAWVTFGIAVGGATVATLTWVATHFLHL